MRTAHPPLKGHYAVKHGHIEYTYVLIVIIVVMGTNRDAMNNHIVVTILHCEELVDWTWEGLPVYEDDPFFVVEVYTEKYGVVSYGELPSRSRTEDTEYHIASDLMELAELLPEQLFGEILCDISEGDF